MNFNKRLASWASGDLSEEETVQLFQEMVDTGAAWQTDGYVGGTIRDLIEAGLVKVPPEAWETYLDVVRRRGW